MMLNIKELEKEMVLFERYLLVNTSVIYLSENKK